MRDEFKLIVIGGFLVTTILVAMFGYFAYRDKLYVQGGYCDYRTTNGWVKCDVIKDLRVSP